MDSSSFSDGDEQAIVKEFENMRNLIREKEEPHIYAASTAPENIQKNRYYDVLPVEETRVILTTKDGKERSDYINANYVMGESSIPQQVYICCQAPLPQTIDDFWRMINEKGCTLIIMLTKLTERNTVKAHPYWPDQEGTTQTYGEAVVSYIKTDSNRGVNGITIRHFDIKHINDLKTKRVVHIQYTDWPDFGVPPSTKNMQRLLTEVDIRKKSLSDPIVVHCSAGIGRTGTFLAIHMNRQKALFQKEELNVMDTVLTLREQRKGMVQSKEQYKFVYATLKDVLTERLDHFPVGSVYARKMKLDKSQDDSMEDMSGVEIERRYSTTDLEVTDKLNDMRYMISHLRRSLNERLC